MRRTRSPCCACAASGQAAAREPVALRLADLSGIVLPGSPADFGKLIAEETEKWAKVIRTAHVKAE